MLSRVQEVHHVGTAEPGVAIYMLTNESGSRWSALEFFFLHICGHLGSSGELEYERSTTGVCEFKRLLGLWAVSNACASRCYYAAAETEEGPRAAGSSHIWHINSSDSCSGTWPFDRSSFHRTHGNNPLLPAETNLYPEEAAAASRAHLDYHSIYNCSFRILYLDECCCG